MTEGALVAERLTREHVELGQVEAVFRRVVEQCAALR
jgi:hypothetical protein